MNINIEGKFKPYTHTHTLVGVHFVVLYVLKTVLDPLQRYFYIETETALHQLLNLFKKKNPLRSGKNMALHKIQESDEKKMYALETIRYGNMICFYTQYVQ